MREIYETIITETDDEGRVIAELFMKLPDPASVIFFLLIIFQ